MRVKLVNLDHAAGLIDPITRRSPFVVVDEKTNEDGTVTHTDRVVEIADVPDNIHWHRRLIAGEVKRVDEAVSEPVADVARVEKTERVAPPTGSEPVKPLTTR